MTVIHLTRAEICARSRSLPRHSRGRRVLESLAREATHAEMRAMFAAAEIGGEEWSREFRLTGGPV